MRTKQTGMTLAEVLVGVAILGTLILATMGVTTAIMRETKTNMDRQFATQKAISMLEELKALVQVNTGTSITVIDDFNDATAFRLRLTTLGGDPNLNPDEPLSGNVRVGSNWLYSRQISVKAMTDPNDSDILISSNDVRLVRVRVYRNLPNGDRQLMSEVAGIVRTLASSFAPSQVYDVYCVAIENVPGWWVNMSTLVTFAQNALSDLQVRHPGLVFRQRMITTLAYGRDSQYQPYINATQDSKSDIPSVYFYPGLLPNSYDTPAGTGAGTNRLTAAQYYYPPANFNGKYRDESGSQNGYSPAAGDPPNPYPYALADQYNHAMRYHDELALYEKRRTAVDPDGDLIYPNEQPTLRFLLDDMVMRPWLYTNAIMINLHGELLPFPPVRNYSDAAKKPDYYVGTSSAAPNGVRVVTHPEQIAYNTDNLTEAASTINLRVYSYLTHPENAIRKKVAGLATDLNSDATTRGEWLPEPITLVIRGVAWAPGAADIRAITGGVDFDRDGARDSYSQVNAAVSDATSPPAGAHRMYFTTAPAGSDTVIRLHNSPLVAPCATPADCDAGGGSGGIEHVDWSDDTRRLYGMEYIPAPMENFASASVQTAFSRNLATTGDDEKNTARWVVKIPTAIFGTNKVVTVETYIGNYTYDATTQSYVSALSPPYAEPTNLSRTYVWRGNANYLFVGNPAADPKTGPALPPSERYQFQGDPRHCPYADLKRPHSGGFAAGNLNPYYGMGYNRYFDGFRYSGHNARSNWPGWSYTAGSPAVTYGVEDADNAMWNDKDIDIPRVFQIWRNALMKSNVLFTTMTGYPFFYVGTGNEIGYDTANGFPSSIPLSRLPFEPELTSTYRYFEHSIGSGIGVRYIQEGNASVGGWWGMNWLGELYPDAWYDITSGPNAGNDWKARGNLPTGTSGAYTTGTFRRVRRSAVPGNTLGNRSHTPGTSLLSAHRTTAQPGIAMFYGAPSNSTVTPDCCNDDQPGDTGELDDDNAPGGGGLEIKNNFNFPLDSPMPAWRPFVINGSADSNAEGLGQAPYGATTTPSWLRKYYDQNGQQNHSSSAVIAVREGSTSNAMFVVANGLSPSGAAGTEYLARWAFLSLIQSYFEAGAFNGGATPAAAQLPRLVITDPNLNTDLSPTTSSVTIRWTINWRRWDGKPYTEAYNASGFAIGAATSYYIMYSTDNGASWKYVQDGTKATPGVKSSVTGHKITNLFYNWAVPAGSFPTGAYIIRVEAYRDAYPLHYSFHQYQMFLNR
jgi:type II secretory pathway pseudopilin PulG